MSNIFDSMLSSGDNSGDKEKPASSNTDATDLGPLQTDKVETKDEGITEVTSCVVKEVTQELLRFGYIEESRKAKLFQKSMIHRKPVLAALEPLDLSFQLDEHRGIAFLKVVRPEDSQPGDEWSHPLVRRQRLTLEQSLLVAMLRQVFVANEQESGVGESAATVAVEDLLPQFLTYFEDSGSDSKNESRLLSILEQLKTHGFISEVDKKQEVTIRPLIAHVADPASLSALLIALKEKADIAELDGFEKAFNAPEGTDE